MPSRNNRFTNHNIQQINYLINSNIIDMKEAKEMVISKYPEMNPEETLQQSLGQTLSSERILPDTVKSNIKDLKEKDFIDSKNEDKYNQRAELLESMQKVDLNTETQKHIMNFFKGIQKVQEKEIGCGTILDIGNSLYNIANSMKTTGKDKGFWMSVTDTLKCFPEAVKFGTKITSSKEELEVLNKFNIVLDTISANKNISRYLPLNDNAKSFIKLAAETSLLIKNVANRTIETYQGLCKSTAITIIGKTYDFVKSYPAKQRQRE